MQNPKINPAMRFNADRTRRDLQPGSNLERAIHKAQHIESRPANYTEMMLRWAEDLILAMWEGNDVADWFIAANRAEAAGWLS